MLKALPFIPAKYIKRPSGKVDLWDIKIDGGPVRVEFTGILAREALQRDPERFMFELPKGIRPGPLQQEADERAAAEQAELEAAQQQDPMHRGNP